MNTIRLIFIFSLAACTAEEPEESLDIRLASDGCTNQQNEDACRSLAELYEGSGRVEEAASVIEASCERGEPLSCGMYGVLLIQAEPENLNAIPHFTTACKGGFGKYCYYGAEMTSRHHGHAAAMPLYEKGCELESIDACTDLAARLISGDPGVRDPERGMALLDKQCARKDPLACEIIGNEYRDRDLTLPENFDPAYDYFRQACELASESACNLAGDLQTERNPPLALQHFKTGCNLGSGSACHNAARIINTSEQIPADDKQTHAYLKRGCELESPRACEMLTQYEALLPK